MRILTISFLAFLLLVSCEPSVPSVSYQNSDYLKVDGDSVSIPSFDIVLEVDEKAKEKLKKEKESILILAYFSGKPKEESAKEYPEFAQVGEISLAKSSLEVSSGYTAKIENIKFSKAIYEDLADKDINLLVNVVSARKSSNENYLDCGIIQGKMSAIMGKSFTIKCKLIGGN